ncbi:MAG TPA: hypothetical protein VIM93_00225 [Kangiella sp.]
MKKWLLVLTVLFLLAGCDDLKVENQLYDKELEIKELKVKNEQLTKDIKGLTAQVARLAAMSPDGIVVEELRKALLQKETQLELRERRYQSNIAALKLKEKRIGEMQMEFYAETGEQLIAVGEAKQVKQDYMSMKKKLESAENRVSNWLTFIMLLTVCFIASIISLIFTGMRYATHRTKIESAMRLVENGNYNDPDKQLLSHVLK